MDALLSAIFFILLSRSLDFWPQAIILDGYIYVYQNITAGVE